MGDQDSGGPAAGRVGLEFRISEEKGVIVPKRKEEKKVSSNSFFWWTAWDKSEKKTPRCGKSLPPHGRGLENQEGWFQVG